MPPTCTLAAVFSAGLAPAGSARKEGAVSLRCKGITRVGRCIRPAPEAGWRWARGMSSSESSESSPPAGALGPGLGGSSALTGAGSSFFSTGGGAAGSGWAAGGAGAGATGAADGSGALGAAGAAGAAGTAGLRLMVVKSSSSESERAAPFIAAADKGKPAPKHTPAWGASSGQQLPDQGLDSDTS